MAEETGARAPLLSVAGHIQRCHDPKKEPDDHMVLSRKQCIYIYIYVVFSGTFMIFNISYTYI